VDVVAYVTGVTGTSGTSGTSGSSGSSGTTGTSGTSGITPVNQITGTGTTNFLPKFTATSTIGDSLFYDNGTLTAVGNRVSTNSFIGLVRNFNVLGTDAAVRVARYTDSYATLHPTVELLNYSDDGVYRRFYWDNFVDGNDSYAIRQRLTGGGATTNGTVIDQTRLMIFSGGNVGIATTTDAGFKLDVNGTGRFRASAATYAGGSLILTSSAGTNPVYLTSNGGYFALSNGGGGDHLLITSTGVFTFNSTGTASGAFISSAITPYWSFQSSAASATGYVGFGNSLITGAAATDFIIRSDNALKFAIGGTAAVTIGGGQLTLNGATSAFMQIVGTTTYSYTQYSSGTNTMYLLQNQNGVSTNGSTVGAAYFYMSNSQDFQFNWLGTTKATITSAGNLTIVGALSKGSGSFRIEHPLPSLSETHHLVHSFIEGPQADLIYRGKLTLVNGKAQANIDEVATMTDGTFEVLCREVQCFTTNESGWDLVKGKVIGNIIYIESQNENSTDEISWMVIGERKDKHMMDTEWTDEDGKVIVEPLKPIEPEPNNNLE
jgi:hypothetical protein